MSKRTPPSDTRRPVSLSDFLSQLNAEDAEQARIAAVRMDDLERGIDDIRDVERRYWWVGAIAAVLFIVGVSVVLYPGETMAPVFRALGPLALTVMVVSLGLVIIVYGALVRRRSEADEAKFALNREHFVPHNAYYFPAETPGEASKVVYFTPRKLTAKRAGPHDNVRPGSSWW